jgi:hypothetical protein
MAVMGCTTTVVGVDEFSPVEVVKPDHEICSGDGDVVGDWEDTAAGGVGDSGFPGEGLGNE